MSIVPPNCAQNFGCQPFLQDPFPTQSCYCDPDCLSFADCCEDYTEFCSTCDGKGCFPGDEEQSFHFCSCESTCVEMDNCCSDFAELCIPGCAQLGCDVSNKNELGDCWCNPYCTFLNACCPDFATVCLSPPPPSPVYEGSCSTPGEDGDVALLCGAEGDGTCWCDDLCTFYGDCCEDYQDVCMGCIGECGGSAQGCWCDLLCTFYNDCCADYFDECGAAPPPPCTHEDGDTNNDQQVNVLDVVTVINSILEFAHSQLTMCEHTASDRNSDGVVDILDVVLTINQVLDD